MPQSLCLTAITHFVGKLQTFIPLLNISLEFVPFWSCCMFFFRAARPEFRRHFLRFGGYFSISLSSPH